MQKFNVIEIQKNVEEKRLVLGKKFEEFLLKKMSIFLSYCGQIFVTKNSVFFGCLIIIATSIFIRSARDIGHDSATYLEIAEKMLAGGRYYYDFFELNFPLSFWLTIIPVFFAKTLAISPIITTEIFINLAGISTVYFSYKILLRSELFKDRKVFNLIILSFTAAFFLRIFTLQFNEFATKTSYFLVLVFPYFSYHLLNEAQLKKFDQIMMGILAGMIFCLKPNYGILVIIFEAKKLLKNRNIAKLIQVTELKNKESVYGVPHNVGRRSSCVKTKSIYRIGFLKLIGYIFSAFCLRNYLTLAILFFYFWLIFFFHPDYIKNFSILSSSYYQVASSAIHLIIKEDIFPLFLFIFLTRFLSKKYPFLQEFYLFNLAAILIVISEMIGGYDQRFIIYSFFLPTLALSCFFLLRDSYFDFRRQGILLFFLLLIPLSDPKNIFALALDICAFWWVFTLVHALRKNKDSLQKNLFSPNDLISWLSFSFVAIAVIALFFSRSTAFLAWILSAILFILMLDSYQKKFSLFSKVVVLLVISYFISLQVAAIFNLKFHQNAFNYKSPNHLNSEMIKTTKANSDKEREVIIISEIILGAYPAITYMNKINQLPSLQMPLLFYQIVVTKENKDQRGFKHLFSSLKEQMRKENNQLIFVEIKNDSAQCHISFLEYYLRDAEFRKIFLSNYHFLNRIIDVEISEKQVEFFNEDQVLKESQSARVRRDVEVYVRN